MAMIGEWTVPRSILMAYGFKLAGSIAGKNAKT